MQTDYTASPVPDTVLSPRLRREVEQALLLAEFTERERVALERCARLVDVGYYSEEVRS